MLSFNAKFSRHPRRKLLLLLVFVACLMPAVLFADGEDSLAPAAITRSSPDYRQGDAKLVNQDYVDQIVRMIDQMRLDKEAIESMLVESKDLELVVLEDLLKKNTDICESLIVVAQGHLHRARQDIRQGEVEPTEVEQDIARNLVRQVTVLADRVSMLQGESERFFERLSTETKNNVVTRIDDPKQ